MRMHTRVDTMRAPPLSHKNKDAAVASEGESKAKNHIPSVVPVVLTVEIGMPKAIRYGRLPAK